jgi:CDP-diacylglycerol---serine O-phosphatidyltransferase
MNLQDSDSPRPRHQSPEHRRRRGRRRRRRAYIRSVYFLPSLCTLGNAICGFGAIYAASLDPMTVSPDPLTRWFAGYQFTAAAYLIFLAMVFDALDGRLARFTRHTTDFGGQLDSLADVISFGAAPAFLALSVFKAYHPEAPLVVSRLIWAIGALYVACAALRLARFNVSNEHGEQHHFSFLGLPSPGAGAAVAALVLVQQDLARGYWPGWFQGAAAVLSTLSLWLIPVLLLLTGLLMISQIRYPHPVNRYLRGRKSIQTLLLAVVVLLALVVAHQYTITVGILAYVLWGLLGYAFTRFRARGGPAPAEGRGLAP